MATVRIYLVSTPSGEHLVEAPNPAQAVKAVTQAGVTVKAASSKDVARLLPTVGLLNSSAPAPAAG